MKAPPVSQNPGGNTFHIFSLWGCQEKFSEAGLLKQVVLQ
ncbi:hypothetical protein TDB9533_00991 [Thalassocella blandensis]|nr:hypothetical protein TDB9533_00991 [Thalassocella blandensis]